MNSSEIVQGRYVLLLKIGSSSRSQCWLAKDCKNSILVAIKIFKSSPTIFQSALEECEILQKLNQAASNREWDSKLKSMLQNEAHVHEGYIVRLLNAFSHFGPNGNHFCLVLEILGPSLSQFLKEIHIGQVSRN